MKRIFAQGGCKHTDELVNTITVKGKLSEQLVFRAFRHCFQPAVLAVRCWFGPWCAQSVLVTATACGTMLSLRCVSCCCPAACHIWIAQRQVERSVDCQIHVDLSCLWMFAGPAQAAQSEDRMIMQRWLQYDLQQLFACAAPAWFSVLFSSDKGYSPRRPHECTTTAITSTKTTYVSLCKMSCAQNCTNMLFHYSIFWWSEVVIGQLDIFLVYSSRQ